MKMNTIVHRHRVQGTEGNYRVSDIRGKNRSQFRKKSNIINCNNQYILLLRRLYNLLKN